MDTILWLKQNWRLLGEKDKIEIISLASLAILPYNINEFISLSKLLHPSYWYIALISKAIRIKILANDDWHMLYKLGLDGIRNLNIGFRSIGYATLAMPIVETNKVISYDLAKRAIKVLPFADKSIFGGAAIRTLDLIIKIGYNIRENIRILVNLINTTIQIPTVMKIDILARASSKIHTIDKNLSIKILMKCFNLFKYTGPESLMEAESIVCSRLVEMFAEDIHTLEKISLNVDSLVRDTIKHAIIRIIQEREGRKFYEIKVDQLESEIRSEIAKTLNKKKKLRDKINKILNSL